MTRDTLPPLHALLALAIVTVWGTNFVIMKFALGHLEPLTLSALRFTLAALPGVFFCKRPAGWGNLAAYGLLIGVGAVAAIGTGDGGARRGEDRERRVAALLLGWDHGA